jgi:hypothetical protein
MLAVFPAWARSLTALLLAGAVLGPGTTLTFWRHFCGCGRLLSCCCLEQSRKAHSGHAGETGAHCDVDGAVPACDLSPAKSSFPSERFGALGLTLREPFAVGIELQGPVATSLPRGPSPFPTAPPTPPPRLAAA